MITYTCGGKAEYQTVLSRIEVKHPHDLYAKGHRGSCLVDAVWGFMLTLTFFQFLRLEAATIRLHEVIQSTRKLTPDLSQKIQIF